MTHTVPLVQLLIERGLAWRGTSCRLSPFLDERGRRFGSIRRLIQQAATRLHLPREGVLHGLWRWPAATSGGLFCCLRSRVYCNRELLRTYALNKVKITSHRLSMAQKREEMYWSRVSNPKRFFSHPDPDLTYQVIPEPTLEVVPDPIPDPRQKLTF